MVGVQNRKLLQELNVKKMDEMRTIEVTNIHVLRNKENIYIRIWNMYRCL